MTTSIAVDEKLGGETTKKGRGGARPNTGGRRNGSGRKKGTPNRLTQDLKSMILGALEAKNGQAYLERVAEEDPRTFCALLGKVLPTTLTSDPDEPVKHVVEIKWLSPSNVKAS